MELITILNRCHRFRGFVYQHAYFSAAKKSIEVAVRPRKGSAAVCSRCHLPAPGYDQLAERRFEFIPLWGVSRLPSVHYAARRLSPLRRCGCINPRFLLTSLNYYGCEWRIVTRRSARHPRLQEVQWSIWFGTSRDAFREPRQSAGRSVPCKEDQKPPTASDTY
jgi:hypothetical protein